MQKFLYKARDGNKQMLEGTLEAESEQDALNQLTQMGYFPLSLQSDRSGPPPADATDRGGGLFSRVRRRDVTLVTRQLADLLEAEVTLVRSLEVLRDQTENVKMARVVGDLTARLRDGKSLSDALGTHPRIFSPLYVSLVRSGEVGGMLPEVLSRLADFSEKEDELRGKIRSAMAYPSLILAVGMTTVAVLLAFVVPRLELLFQESGQALPMATQVMIDTSKGLLKYWPLILSGIVLVGFLVKRGGLSAADRTALDRLKLRIPVWGSLLRKVEIARFTRSLGTLLKHGVPILSAMGVASQAAGNRTLADDLGEVSKKLQGGSTLAQAIAANSLFPATVRQMIAVAEEAGTLDRSLLRIAETYEREAERAMKTISTLLEPAMILFVGLVVGGIVISMLLPIFQLDLMAR